MDTRPDHQALIGRFHPDAHHFTARPIRHRGQPHQLLPELAGIYRATAHEVATLVLSAWPWKRIEHATSDPTALPGFGIPGGDHRDPGVDGNITDDQPWHDGEWAYLWEHDNGALHVYAAWDARWHHLATLTVELLRRSDVRLGRDIETRLDWVMEAGVGAPDRTRTRLSR